MRGDNFSYCRGRFYEGGEQKGKNCQSPTSHQTRGVEGGFEGWVRMQDDADEVEEVVGRDCGGPGAAERLVPLQFVAVDCVGVHEACDARHKAS